MSYDVKRVARAFSAVTLGDVSEEHVQEIRKAGFQLASEILQHAPSCPEQTLAINKVREAVMYASQAVALHQGI